MEIITNIREKEYSPLCIACDLNLNDDEMMEILGEKRFERIFGEPNEEEDYPLARIAVKLYNNAMEADGDSHMGDVFYANIRSTYPELAKHSNTLDCYLEGADELEKRKGIMVDIYMYESIPHSKLKKYQNLVESKITTCIGIANMLADGMEPIFVGIPCYNGYMRNLGKKILKNRKYTHNIDFNAFHISTVEDEFLF